MADNQLQIDALVWSKLIMGLHIRHKDKDIEVGAMDKYVEISAKQYIKANKDTVCEGLQDGNPDSDYLNRISPRTLNVSKNMSGNVYDFNNYIVTFSETGTDADRAAGTAAGTDAGTDAGTAAGTAAGTDADRAIASLSSESSDGESTQSSE